MLSDKSLGEEWSMSEVGIPPPHNLDNPHALVAGIQQQDNNKTTINLIKN